MWQCGSLSYVRHWDVKNRRCYPCRDIIPYSSSEVLLVLLFGWALRHPRERVNFESFLSDEGSSTRLTIHSAIGANHK